MLQTLYDIMEIRNNFCMGCIPTHLRIIRIYLNKVTDNGIVSLKNIKIIRIIEILTS